MRREKPWRNGTLHELEACPFDPQQHVTPCAFLYFSKDGLAVARCLHDSCVDRGWWTLCRQYNVPDDLAGARTETKDAGQRKVRAKEVIELVMASGAVLFHTKERNPYAAIIVPATDHVPEHAEVHAIGHDGFNDWVRDLIYTETGHPPSTQVFAEAINHLKAYAKIRGPEDNVYVRVAALPDRTYLDLGDREWRVVEITENGWHVADGSPVYFRRHGTHDLPLPADGGDVHQLRRVLNFPLPREGEDDQYADAWRLTLTWLSFVLRGVGPFPPYVLEGPPGSVKTTAARLLRSTIDPRVGGVRRPSRDEEDLMISAWHSLIVCYDNLSRIPEWLSDALCGIATGTAGAKRTLFSDQGETITEAERATMLTGIDHLPVRGDLVDRAIVVHLDLPPEIAPGKGRHKSYVRVYREYLDLRPTVLGALCSIVSFGLRTLPDISDEHLPRMAEFARWGQAIAPSLGWTAQDFLRAYAGVRAEGQASVLDNSLVVPPLLRFVPEGAEWIGAMKDLLGHLTALVPEKIKNDKEWPRTPEKLRGDLGRVQNDLAAVEYMCVMFNAGTGRHRRDVKIVHNSPPEPDEDEEKTSGGTTQTTGTPSPEPSNKAETRDGARDGSPEEEATVTEPTEAAAEPAEAVTVQENEGEPSPEPSPEETHGNIPLEERGDGGNGGDGSPGIQETPPSFTPHRATVANLARALNWPAYPKAKVPSGNQQAWQTFAMSATSLQLQDAIRSLYAAFQAREKTSQ
jgi:hypothetical protein